MGKTRKRMPYSYLRRPRGYKRARANGARAGAVPPHAWDDINFDDQCYIPYKVALALHQKGKKKEDIIRHLRNKFKMTQLNAEKVVDIHNFFWRGCRCKECVDWRNSTTRVAE